MEGYALGKIGGRHFVGVVLLVFWGLFVKREANDVGNRDGLLLRVLVPTPGFRDSSAFTAW